MPQLQPLTVPGDLASLKAIRDYVSDAAAQAGLDRILANRLRLAVDEIVTNSIVHGYDEAGLRGDVRLMAQIDGDKLTIVAEDEGKTYDPTQHNLPDEETLGAPLDTREIGGLGIYLAINSIDEFRFERIGSRNRNIFVMYRPKVEASA
jgi:anti-sigma regulatory factor (Ser/Thr protein kinase)